MLDSWKGQELDVFIEVQDGNLLVETGRCFGNPRAQHVSEDGEDLRHPYADQVMYPHSLSAGELCWKPYLSGPETALRGGGPGRL